MAQILACDHGNRTFPVMDQYGQTEVLGREIGTLFNAKTTNIRGEMSRTCGEDDVMDNTERAPY